MVSFSIFRPFPNLYNSYARCSYCLRTLANDLPSTIGSAPDIAGTGTVNPIAAILSVAMMLQYSLQLPEEAKLIEEAVRRTIDKGFKTKDIGGTASTQEVGDAVVQELETLLKP